MNHKSIRLKTDKHILLSMLLCVLFLIPIALMAQIKQHPSSDTNNQSLDSNPRDSNFTGIPGTVSGQNAMFEFDYFEGSDHNYAPSSLKYRALDNFARSHGTPKYRGIVPGQNSVSYIEIDGDYYAYKGGKTLTDADKVKTLPTNRINDPYAYKTVVTSLDSNPRDVNFTGIPGTISGQNSMFTYDYAEGPSSLRYRNPNDDFAKHHNSPMYRGFVPAEKASYLEINGKFYAYKGGKTLTDADEVKTLPPNRIGDGVVSKAPPKYPPAANSVVTDKFEDGIQYPASVTGSNGVYKITIDDPNDGKKKTYDVFRAIPKLGDTTAIKKFYKDQETAQNTLNFGDWMTVKKGSVYVFSFTDPKTASISTETLDQAESYYIIPKEK